MALVLTGRYSSVVGFYKGRMVRFFPIYWVVLGLSILACLVSGAIGGNWLMLGAYMNEPLSHNGFMGVAWAALSNLTLWGQDSLLFLSHPASGSLEFTTNYAAEKYPLYRFAFVPQAWTAASSG